MCNIFKRHLEENTYLHPNITRYSTKIFALCFVLFLQQYLYISEIVTERFRNYFKLYFKNWILFCLWYLYIDKNDVRIQITIPLLNNCIVQIISSSSARYHHYNERHFFIPDKGMAGFTRSIIKSDYELYCSFLHIHSRCPFVLLYLYSFKQSAKNIRTFVIMWGLEKIFYVYSVIFFCQGYCFYWLL